MNHIHYMQTAITLAQKAAACGEVPIGAVLVSENTIIGKGWNQPIAKHDPTAHAEILAIRDAAFNINNYRLTNTTLYVTLEPCMMCVGAIFQARIPKVIYASADSKMGACESVYQLLGSTRLNHLVQFENGLMAEESQRLLKEFFQSRR